MLSSTSERGRCPFGPCRVKIVSEDPVSHYVLDGRGESTGFVFLTIKHYRELLEGITRMPQPSPAETGASIAVTPFARENFLRLFDAAEERGVATYGTTLKTFNGRSARLDALEELIDAWKYLEQWASEDEVLLTTCEEVLLAAREALNSVMRNPLTGGCAFCGSTLRAMQGHEQTCRYRIVTLRIEQALKLLAKRSEADGQDR